MAVPTDPDRGDELYHVEEALQVRVVQQSGQKLTIQASAHIPLATNQAFQLIVHPKNEQVRQLLPRPLLPSLLLLPTFLA